MTMPPDLRNLVGDIREAVSRLPHDALIEILVYVFKEYVVEGAPRVGGAMDGTRSDAGASDGVDGAASLGLEGMTFAEVVRTLQLNLDLPELELFEVDADRVYLRSGSTRQPIESPDTRPAPLPPSVRHLNYAPLGELLPLACALVHHGGIGTSARGLKAGIPQVIMPLSYDQFDNVDRLKGLGVARSVKRKRLTGRKLATVLRRLMESSEVGARCRRFAARLAESNAAERTCEWLEDLSNRQ